MVLQTLATAPMWLAADPFVAERDRMVREQIQARGVNDAGVLRVLRDTPRDRFVPAGWRERAYEDTPLPIGHGATISQPFVVGMMTQLLEARKIRRTPATGNSATGTGLDCPSSSVASGTVSPLPSGPGA